MGDWLKNSSCGLPNLVWIVAIIIVVVVLIAVAKPRGHHDGLQAVHRPGHRPPRGQPSPPHSGRVTHHPPTHPIRALPSARLELGNNAEYDIYASYSVETQEYTVYWYGDPEETYSLIVVDPQNGNILLSDNADQVGLSGEFFLSFDVDTPAIYQLIVAISSSGGFFTKQTIPVTFDA